MRFQSNAGRTLFWWYLEGNHVYRKCHIRKTVHKHYVYSVERVDYTKIVINHIVDVHNRRSGP